MRLPRLSDPVRRAKDTDFHRREWRVPAGNGASAAILLDSNNVSIRVAATFEAMRLALLSGTPPRAEESCKRTAKIRAPRRRGRNTHRVSVEREKADLGATANQMQAP